MLIIENRLKELEHYQQKAKEGKKVSLDLKYMPKLSKAIAGIQRGELLGITGDTASGKTKFCKSILWNIYMNKQRADFRIIYFGLEESAAEFIDSVIVTFYQFHNNEEIDIKQLKSTTEDPLPHDFFYKIRMISNDIQDFMDHITYIETEHNPTGIYKACKKIASQYGEHVYRKEVYKDPKSNTEKAHDVYDHYKITNDDMHVIAVIDHLSLLKPEDSSGNVTKDNHSAQNKWVVRFAKPYLTKMWNWTVIDIMQQTVANDFSLAFGKNNSPNSNRLEPSLDKLGNNKEVAREHYTIFGVFNPSYFDIYIYPTHPNNDNDCYNLSGWGNYFRSIKLLKNRNGLPVMRFHYYFYGNSFRFEDAPHFTDTEGLDTLMKKHSKRKLII